MHGVAIHYERPATIYPAGRHTAGKSLQFAVDSCTD